MINGKSSGLCCKFSGNRCQILWHGWDHIIVHLTNCTCWHFSWKLLKTNVFAKKLFSCTTSVFSSNAYLIQNLFEDSRNNFFLNFRDNKDCFQNTWSVSKKILKNWRKLVTNWQNPPKLAPWKRGRPGHSKILNRYVLGQNRKKQRRAEHNGT